MDALIFADMDGTFLADDKSVPSRNLRVLDAFCERRMAFVPCTGRPVSAVPQQVMDHAATQFAVGSNGAVVYDVHNKMRLHVSSMSKERVVQLYERVKDLHATFDIFADGEVFSERARYEAMGGYGIDEPSLAVLRRVRKPVDLLVPDIVERAHTVEKVTCFWRSEEDRVALERAICEVGGFSSAHGHPKNFELQAKGVSKGSALVWLCDYAGVPVDQTVAFGDEANDLPMICLAGKGVAMANATPDVLAAADYVTGSNDAAGVAAFLEEHVLHA